MLLKDNLCMYVRETFNRMSHYFFSGINCYNPAFDETPAELITGGIITEFGVFQPSELHKQLKSLIPS